MGRVPSFDTARLIREVHRRPMLWDSRRGDYQNKSKRAAEWTDVARAINKKWDSLNDAEKTVFGNDLRRRWRNIRDNFMKTKRLLTSSGSSKKQKYAYYEQLLFLEPTIYEKTFPAWSKVKLEAHDENEESQDYTLEHPLMVDEEEFEEDNAVDEDQDEKPPLPVAPVCDLEYDETNDDRLFLLSVVPLMKTMSTRQKIKTRMDILQVVQNNLDSMQE